MLLGGDFVIIYKITNKTNGKIYIGQTVRTLKERIDEHKRHAWTIMGKVFKKYDRECLVIEIIDTALTIEELNEKEIKYISLFNCITPKGYNQCNGGNNTIGFHHREVSKKNMSIKKSEIYLGDNNPFYGKTHSDEQRAKWSAERKITYADQIAKAQKASLLVITRKVINLDTEEIFNSITEAGEKYGIFTTHITRVCKGRRKRTGGFRWQYLDEYMAIPCQASNEEGVTTRAMPVL